MPTGTSNIDDILNQIEKLDHSERIHILEKIILLLKKDTGQPEKIKLSAINGLGAEIWKNVNIDKYVADERLWD